ncbi:MAG: hypothetical protein HC767_06570 [Akkermansiaceae bacterium]|nr:hypothetical protein [Akkermansiaceae bacterium]
MSTEKPIKKIITANAAMKMAQPANGERALVSLEDSDSDMGAGDFQTDGRGGSSWELFFKGNSSSSAGASFHSRAG